MNPVLFQKVDFCATPCENGGIFFELGFAWGLWVEGPFFALILHRLHCTLGHSWNQRGTQRWQLLEVIEGLSGIDEDWLGRIWVI